MINLILCGGSGTRLWPLSRTLLPKQFVKVFGSKSLFQLTVERNKETCDSYCIISNTEQFFLAVDQYNETENASDKNKSTGFLLEPTGRNTAPAIALACMLVNREDTVLITPSDHLIKKYNEYNHVLAQGQKLAEQGYLVTFGIKPEYAETGYGYIEANGQDVLSFHEKPNLAKAHEYLDRGNFYWNSGIFCFKAGVFLDELRKYSPAIFDACVEALKDLGGELVRIPLDKMMNIPEDSIDYAVMEKSDKVKVVASDIGWSDMGSFDSLSQELENDDNNNLIISEKFVSTIDVSDLIIVDTVDALLVSKKGSSQKVKDVVNKLKNENSELPNTHQTVHRPWGSYTVLEDTPGFKIKKIEVKPGQRLSLQKHYHRNEHWVVVSGTATVANNSKVFVLRQNESTFIKMGEEHRLANEGIIPLVLIEVQIGEYTGEDDIVRIEDDYERMEVETEQK